MVAKTFMPISQGIDHQQQEYRSPFGNNERICFPKKRKGIARKTLKTIEAIIDLTIGFNDLFENIKKEYRTKIRSAEKKGIKIYKEKCEEILSRIKRLEEIIARQSAKIYAFSSIMRISNNNINEEEKEYWSQYGQRIFEYSYNLLMYSAYSAG